MQVGVAAEGYAGVAGFGSSWGHEIVAVVAARGVVAACVGEVVGGFKLWWLVEARWVEGVGRVVVYGLLLRNVNLKDVKSMNNMKVRKAQVIVII